jgi:asparagine synthase (glutamine-hydrolysing)
MCGICGVVSIAQNDKIEKEILLKMMDSMVHRGPDDEGIYIDSNMALGSRRLSIIDVAGGRQPISNEDQSLWIVFNGEIYNFKELRRYLDHKGHTLCTQTDTEVILHLYEEFGADCVNHLNGIFAFAIWDKYRKELLLARDRMGIKPLYYTQVNGQLIFGSEMKVLLANPAVQAEIDLIALSEYLSYEFVPTPHTIISKVYRLEPGHTLRFSRRGLEIQQYWNLSLARSESRPPVDWHDYTNNMYDTLQASVQKELVSDVPVGVLLSGGIDSSTVAAFMVDAYPGKVDSFSVGFEEPSFDESYYARKVASHLGTQHHELILTAKKAAELVPSITDFLDEPFGDSSLIPTFLLSKFAGEHVKVVLGGDGGDELFAGYPTLTAHKLIEFYERVVPRILRAKVAPKFIDMMPVSFNNLSTDFKIKRFLAGRGVPLQARHHRWLGSFVDEEKALLLQDWITPILNDTYKRAYRHGQDCDAVHHLNKILYTDIKMYLEGDILFKVDRASMAASLEVRVPFLNRDVVQFASELPLSMKLNRFTGKYLLKKCMGHRLPQDVIHRRKKGFNMPVANWLTKDLREVTLDLLSQEFVIRQGLFQYGYIKQLLEEHSERRRDHRKLLWTLLVFQLWYRKYI